MSSTVKSGLQQSASSKYCQDTCLQQSASSKYCQDTCLQQSDSTTVVSRVKMELSQLLYIT